VLNAIVRFALRFRGVVIALATALLAYGVYAVVVANYDVFPEFSPPFVQVQTEAPGLSSEQVELLVTQPLENAINGVAGIESLRSGTIQGLSVVTVVFQPDTDIYRDRQVLAERLAEVSRQLPQGVRAPVMTPLTSSTSTVLAVGLTSEQHSLMSLRTIADWVVRQRLLAVPGVAKVAAFGGQTRQLQVQFLPQRLMQFNLSVDDVLGAARRASGIRGAGFIETANQRLILQTEGQSITPQQLAATVVVHQNGANVTLGDVARVVEGPEPPIGGATIMGQTGVMLVVAAQYGTNTLEVTRNVEQALDELAPALRAEGVSVRADILRPANFIQMAVRNVRASLLLGALLVVVVLLLFLFNFRTAAISCTAIPLSLLAAVTILVGRGYSLNTMTLGGLAIAIGEVVDDAVIDVENILRRLRENHRSANPAPAFRVVFDASIEVRSAVVYATFAVTLVFLPILTMSGVAGRLFAPLGMAYILAIMASLVVALTVTPALCLVLLGRGQFQPEEPGLVRWLKRRYRTLLEGVERRPRTVVVAVLLFTAAGLSALPFLGGGFLPELNEGHFILHMSAVPGTSLDESLRMGRQITGELLKFPFVRTVGQKAGRAELSEDIYGAHYSEIEIDLKPMNGEEAELAQAEIRKMLTQFTGANFSLKTFLTERIEETVSGYMAPVVVNIYGPDLDTLDAEAQEVARVLGTVPGALEVMMQSPMGTPQLAVNLRKPDLLRWGFDSVTVLDAVRTAYQGETVGQVYEGNRVFDVSVILPAQERRSVASIGALPLRSPAGAYLPLAQLADVYQASGRYLVLHQGARRVQTVTCNVAGGDTESFVAKARRQILSRVSFPAGSYPEFAGTAAAQIRSRRDLLVHSVLAGLGIVILLSFVMKHYRNLLLVLLNLPFALVGGVLAAFAAGGVLSLGSLVGFVTLFGITLRNSIMMISHYEHLIAEESAPWGLETALRGASERLTPILMTALVTALGLLPLAIGSGDPGREIEGPMAMIILGGLITSTALNLLVLPTLALRFGRFQPAGNEGE
jgi:CzcA family heavy metal efflux pump